jgi:hypothetical protein
MRKIIGINILELINHSLSNKHRTFSKNYNQYLLPSNMLSFFIYKDLGVGLVANQYLEGGRGRIPQMILW